MASQDLSFEKCTQAIVLIPYICSHYKETPKCQLCRVDCPVDIAINSVASFRDRYIKLMALARSIGENNRE